MVSGVVKKLVPRRLVRLVVSEVYRWPGSCLAKMPQTHVDEDEPTHIAEALHSNWSYPQIKEKEFASNDPQIALLVR